MYGRLVCMLEHKWNVNIHNIVSRHVSAPQDTLPSMLHVQMHHVARPGRGRWVGTSVVSDVGSGQPHRRMSLIAAKVRPSLT